MIIHSSNIIDAEYDARKRVMQILFQNAGTYEVREFPPDLFTALVTAKSPGNFFSKSIREQFKDKTSRVQTLCNRCGSPVVKGQEFGFQLVNEGKSKRACHTMCIRRTLAARLMAKTVEFTGKPGTSFVVKSYDDYGFVELEGQSGLFEPGLFKEFKESSAG